jgi:glycosyltransferase domain-containing protein
MAKRNEPLVSVVIPTYNREKTLARSIISALNQSYKNIEVLVVDDGSTDGTKKVVQGIKSPKVRYIYRENEHCHVYPMNDGARAAEGKYVAILDDDDFWCDKNKIKKQVNFLENNKDHVLVGGGAIKVDENGNEIVRYILPEDDPDIRKTILVSDTFVHVTTLFRKDAWEKVGGYDENFDGMEDWDLWMRMGRIGKFHNIPEFFVTYAAHQQDSPGYVESKYGKWEWLKLNLKLKNNYRNDYPNYKRAIIFCWMGYLYSILPFRYALWPAMFKIKNYFFNIRSIKKRE